MAMELCGKWHGFTMGCPAFCWVELEGGSVGQEVLSDGGGRGGSPSMEPRPWDMVIGVRWVR